jgi:hypothetical protein
MPNDVAAPTARTNLLTQQEAEHKQCRQTSFAKEGFPGRLMWAFPNCAGGACAHWRWHDAAKQVEEGVRDADPRGCRVTRGAAMDMTPTMCRRALAIALPIITLLVTLPLSGCGVTSWHKMMDAHAELQAMGPALTELSQRAIAEAEVTP